jgi:hypothetical protein
MADLSFTDEEKELIKQAQLARVRAGSDMMLIHLGKTVLGQQEKQHLTIEAIPFSNHTIEELMVLLEERAAERGESIALAEFSATQLIGPNQ